MDETTNITPGKRGPKSATDKIRGHLAKIDQASPQDHDELLRLCALCSYELQNILGASRKGQSGGKTE